VAALPLVPEWYLLLGVLGALAALGFLWRPLFLSLPLLVCGLVVSVVQALHSAGCATYNLSPLTRSRKLRLHVLTTALHLVQPAARLWGRMQYGLTPWRRRGPTPSLLNLPMPHTALIWSEQWEAADQRLRSVERILREQSDSPRRGSEFDRWDLELRGGLFTCVRARMAIEEYPGGRQYVRFRCWPVIFMPALLALVWILLLASAATVARAHGAAAILAALALFILLRATSDCGAAMRSFTGALSRYRRSVESSEPAAIAPTAPATTAPETPEEVTPLAEVDTELHVPVGGA
jgi:hypothetical protein